MPVAVVDIGSTRFKAGVCRGEGGLEIVHAEAAPALEGEQSAREGDGERFLEAATAVWEAARAAVPPPARMGLTAQRSSFLVWDAAHGRPVSPLYSWQDRQAEAWCARHRNLAPMIETQTGLRLSPHYFAPKLAWLMEQEASIARGLSEGLLRAGTLDSFLLWRWSGGAVFVTDPTMAARTLLVELGEADWSPALLSTFGIPRGALPAIRPSVGTVTPLAAEVELRALVSDQAAGLLGAIGAGSEATLVNLGTGGFVLKPVGPAPRRVPGYLCGPYCSEPGRMRFALEGTINGIGPALASFGDTPMPFPHASPATSFCLPDATGIGAPYWRPELPQTYSALAQPLPVVERRRVFLEGVLFRLSEILADLDAGHRGDTLYLSGGMTHEPMLVAGLASMVDAEVRLLEDRESTLLGIALLAAGLRALRPPASRPVAADPELADLRERYPEWRRWMRTIMEPNDEAPR